MHALVPGGRPSLSGDRWIVTRHPRQRRKRKPYLVDNRLLSERFRELFIAGVERLRRRGELQVEDAAALDTQLATLRDSPWVVYVEAPPHEAASPENVLKYLARYMTGGPIADRRLRSHEQGQVTFLARSDEKPAAGSRPRQVPVTLSGVEFVRRWSLHILPKGYTKVRRRPTCGRCPRLQCSPPPVVLIALPRVAGLQRAGRSAIARSRRRRRIAAGSRWQRLVEALSCVWRRDDLRRRAASPALDRGPDQPRPSPLVHAPAAEGRMSVPSPSPSIVRESLSPQEPVRGSRSACRRARTIAVIASSGRFVYASILRIRFAAGALDGLS